MAPPKKQVTEAVEPADKAKVRQQAVAALNKKFGSGTISTMSNWDAGDVSTIPTGCIGLDVILGRGGWPRGRISEITGFESSGKSTLMLHAVAEAQKVNGAVAYVDVEHALDPVYAEALGVNMDELFISQPDSGEQALTIVEELIKSKSFDMIVVDSVAAIVPQKEVDGEMGASQMGSQARLMSQAMRKLVPIVGDSNCVLLFVNQYRSTIGKLYGPTETSTGGNALRYAASVRVEIRKGKAIKDGDKVIGNITHLKTIKNKIAPPFRSTEFNLIYGQGVDRFNEVITYGLLNNIIEKTGNTYTFNGDKIGVGSEAARAYFCDNQEAGELLEKQVYEVINHGAPAVVGTADEDDAVEETPHDEETGEVL